MQVAARIGPGTGRGRAGPRRELGPDGIFHRVVPSESLDDSEGVVHDGGTLQFGLTKREIDKVWHRIQKLKEQVDDGSLPVF